MIRGTPQLVPNMCNIMILTKVRSFVQVSAGSMSELRSHQTKCVVEETKEEQETENNDYMVRVVV